MELRMNGAMAKLLSESRIYRSYAKAFRELSGLSLHLRPVGPSALSRNRSQRQKWSCAMLGQPNCGCKSCAESFERLAAGDLGHVIVMRCGCRCCGVAMPVRSGKDIVALLQVRSACGHSSPAKSKERKYRASLELASIFCEQLSGLCNRILMQKRSDEFPVIAKAKDFIAQHFSEDISSRQAAQNLHLSRFYFCTLFKKNTGLTFTDYLSRVRTERVKELLTNPNLRISDIAFQTGFQSLTHFNRVFLKLTGTSPTAYRRNLADVLDNVRITENRL